MVLAIRTEGVARADFSDVAGTEGTGPVTPAAARAILADTAIILGERFGTAAEFWLNLRAGVQ
jgi:hypothetical protein